MGPVRAGWLAAGAVALLACSPSPPPPPPAAAPVSPPPAVSTAEASLKVKARMEGPAPRFVPIDFSRDAHCQLSHPEPVYPETVVAKDGRLANVIAWVSNGVSKGMLPVPQEPVALVIRDCLFRPHVLTLTCGQPLVLRGGERGTHHNFHGIPKVNPGFNHAVIGGESKDPIERFSEEDVGIRVKDDVHGWMEAWLGVFAHPYHGVTGEDGSLTLKVPPGSYEVSAWHEYRKFAKPAPLAVTVAAGESMEVEFVFRVP